MRVIFARSGCTAALLLSSSLWASEPIQPIPNEPVFNENAVLLGEKLFRDPILSKDNLISCSVCHQLENGGDDNLPLGITSGEDTGLVNTPTVFNARYNFRQMWNGRSKDLAQQLDMVLSSPLEHNTSWDEVITKLSADPFYSKTFKQNYPDGITRNNVTDAIVQFQNTLTTPDSRFDLYLKGDPNAITADEKKGYEEFKNQGCTNCHQGINIGGNLYQRIGVFYDYLRKRGHITEADYGRYNFTGREQDRFVFKVPGLRNVEVTAPYFHDGQVQHLDEAVRMMGRTQIATILDEDDVELIVKFLRTLTGKYKGVSLSTTNQQQVSAKQ